MSLTHKKPTIAYERAEFARSVEYMREMFRDELLAERMTEVYEMEDGYDKEMDDAEVDEIDDALEVDGDEDNEVEIERIMGATEPISLDEIIGVTNLVKTDD